MNDDKILLILAILFLVITWAYTIYFDRPLNFPVVATVVYGFFIVNGIRKLKKVIKESKTKEERIR